MLGSSLADSAPAAHGSALPLLPPPFCVAKGRAGEGLAFVAFQAPLSSRLTPLLQGWWMAWKAPAEHGSALPLLLPPFCVAKGRAGEGLAFVAFQAPLSSRLTPLLQGWWMAWKAPAEHGSALPLLPPPLRRRRRGGLGRGWLLWPFRRRWLRGLRRSYRAGGWLGKPLPSMARHYRFCSLPSA